jgi:hypothetical protein
MKCNKGGATNSVAPQKYFGKVFLVAGPAVFTGFEASATGAFYRQDRQERRFHKDRPAVFAPVKPFPVSRGSCHAVHPRFQVHIRTTSLMVSMCCRNSSMPATGLS